MKKLLLSFCAIALCIGFTACNGKLKETEAQLKATQDSLAQIQTDNAELNALIQEINDGMEEIKQIEGIISTTNVGGETSQADKIRSDLQAIANTIKERRDRLTELETRLQNEGKLNDKSKKAIADARAQIDEQAKQIETLAEELRKANEKIDQLNTQVEGLNKDVETANKAKAEEEKAKREAEAKATELENQLNTCYYAIGSNKELKKNNIISKKFLGRTKVMENDKYELSYFTKGDKRSLTTINLHSKKAKVLTTQPKDSYEITENDNGTKVLNIKDPKRFWEKSDFLVIQID